MKTAPIQIAGWISLLLLVTLALVGCQTEKVTPDVAATVAAGIQATATAQAHVQATVDAAIKATATAQAVAAPKVAATPTSAPVAAAPTATKPPASPAPVAAAPTVAVNYTTLTEEELAALIDKAVTEALTASNAATTTTASYTADGTITAQEAAAMTKAVLTAQTEIAEAQSAITAYYDLYAELATEAVNTLKLIEQDLNSVSTSMNAMAQSLAQINTTLAQGLTLAQSTVTQLQATATKASQVAQQAQTKVKTWSTTVQADLTKRANAALAVAPNATPTDLRGTVQSVNTYLDTVKGALGDNKISQKDLQAISQAGANASAGLKQFGGTQGQQLADTINGMTKQLARGEAPKAKGNLGALEQSAKSLPALPSGGGVQIPQPPRK